MNLNNWMLASKAELSYPSPEGLDMRVMTHVHVT